MIQMRRVSVNGQIVDTLGTRVDPFVDKVMVDGQSVEYRPGRKTVLAFNKPVGVISTMVDEQGRPCIRDYVDETWGRVFHVGRLDQESSGLLVLTDDGDLAFQLAHPKHEIKKTYLVDVLTSDIDLFVKAALKGVTLPDGVSKADRCIHLTPSQKTGTPQRLLWQLHDGKNRVIRRVAESLDAKVLRLHRVAVGNYLMTTSTSGSICKLTYLDVKKLTSKPDELLINRITEMQASL